MVDKIRPVDDQPSLYTLQGIEDRKFTIEQLQVIPHDTEDLNIELE